MPSRLRERRETHGLSLEAVGEALCDDTAFENLDRGVSVVVTAPLLDELRDSDWLQRVAHRCSARRAQLIPLWVRCDAGSMHDHLAIRGAGRDTWKLSNWHDHLASMDLGMRPRGEHIVIDNTLGAAVGVADLTRLRLQVPVALP